MGFVVDEVEIESRWRGGRTCVVVSLEGIDDRDDCRRLVEPAAVAGARGEVEFVRATEAGTFVWFETRRRWASVVTGLVHRLESAGWSGSVSAGTARSVLVRITKGAMPVAAMGVRQTGSRPPIHLDDNPMQFGVEPDRARDLLGRLTDWASLGGPVGDVQGAPQTVPVVSADAADVAWPSISKPRSMNDVWVDFDHGKGGRAGARSVRLDIRGEVSLFEDAPDRSTRENFEGLARVLSSCAQDIDVGLVRVGTYPYCALSTDLQVSLLWNENRDLWSSRVPDAFGIMLLSDAHLERATDLSDWQVDQVAPGRWLLQARDLEPWLLLPDFTGRGRDSTPATSAEVLTAARAGLGEMILSPANAEHPVT